MKCKNYVLSFKKEKKEKNIIFYKNVVLFQLEVMWEFIYTKTSIDFEIMSIVL